MLEFKYEPLADDRGKHEVQVILVHSNGEKVASYFDVYVKNNEPVCTEDSIAS